ncbi:unnamed protein product [Auanema sp. JU1783]|nr:unnamed protein product [Auanema sp. JU1783]
MDEGSIIPDVAYGNRSYRIVRKRDSSTISPLTNLSKRSAKCMNEPDGPIHKYTVVNGKVGEEIIISDEESNTSHQPNRRGTIEMDDVFDIQPVEKVPYKATSVYYSAESSPEKTPVVLKFDPNKRIGAIDLGGVEGVKTSRSQNEKSETAVSNEFERKRKELLKKASTLTGTYKIEPDLNRQFTTDHSFFSISSLVLGDLPLPYPAKPHDDILNYDKPGFVQLPWSTQNMVGNVRRYVQVLRSLQCIEENMSSIHTLPINIREYHNISNFDGLINYYEELPSNEDKKEFLKTISGIASLALRAEAVITKPIPYLTLQTETRSTSSCSISLSQEQCACLLANGFFCTFSERSEKFGEFNMDQLFSSTKRISQVKFQFIIEYFKTVLKKMPDGVVSFRRVSIKNSPDFEESTKPIPLMEFGDGKIEDYIGALQVDFANRYIGGGVLGRGAVQEEIMFLQRPEMIVSILLAPRMNAHEAIFISGAQQYSSYSGYANRLRWVPVNPDNVVVRDKFKRINHEIVAIDAKNVSEHPEKQYDVEMIDRELLKCYVGFHTGEKEPYIKPIATGNWGCGVFGGDLQLKALIQLLAAGAAGRELIYVPFNEERFKTEFRALYQNLRKRNIQIGVLYGILSNYCMSKTNLTVFEYVLECLA